MRKPCCDKQGTNKGAWSKQEDQKLIDYIRTHGEGCWRSLPKAADNEVKNYWNSHIKRKLIKLGIDPNNHKLNQYPLRPQPQHVSPSSPASLNVARKPRRSSAAKDRVSDAASCLEDERSGRVSKLDLDLTIAFPPTPTNHHEEKQQNTASIMTSEEENYTAPTLLLFR
ncbi:SANT/Myb domain - like 10 [Theobroma cacao]|nr:SANT/Myb domain - like 10 [Theobroma cacao]